jgi:chemotaxis protein CheD
MSLIVVGIADCRIATIPGDVLVTYALGSCIGMAVYDPGAAVGGLLHFMLPDSAILGSAQRAETPYKFADTGIPLLFERMSRAGAQKRRLVVRIAGAARMMDPGGVFDIGRRNHQALRRLLWKAGVLVHGEAVGGTVSRTVRLEIGTGRLWLREAAGPEQEMPLAAARKGENQWHIAS